MTGSNVLVLTVTPVNDAPVADPQLVTTNEDTARAITLSANDVDGDALGYSIVSGPSHGTLSGSGANRTYTPATNYNGSDSFAFRANDGTAGSNIATVSITVKAINDAPTIASISNRATNEDTSTGAITFPIFDVDTAVASLTLSASSTNTTLVQNANITFGGSGASRTVTVVPAANQFGTTIIKIVVSDGTLTTSSGFALTVTPVNDAPVAYAQSITTNEDTWTEIILSASDVDGDFLYYAIVSNDQSHGTLMFTSDTNRIYIPATNYNGAASYTFKVFDGTVSSNIATVSIIVTPVNDAPTISILSNRATNEDTSTGAIAFTVGDVDTAAASLTLSASSTNTTLVPHANITFGGSGASRTVTVVPAANQFGTTIIKIIVRDGTLTTSSSFRLTVTPVNDAPDAVNDSVAANKNTSVTINTLINDSDVDGDSLTVLSNTQGAHGTVQYSAKNRNFRYTPARGFKGTDTSPTPSAMGMAALTPRR